MKLTTCSIVLALALSVVAGAGATREWIAHFTDNPIWSNPGNWQPQGVPQNGDELVFHSTVEEPSPRQDMINDLVGLEVRNLYFCGYGWMLSGNELKLLEELNRVRDGQCGASGFIVNCPLRIGQRVDVQIGWGTIILRGPITLTGGTLYLNSGDQMIVSSPIGGTGEVVATIDGFIRASTITFEGTVGNTFSGRMRIQQIYDEIGHVEFNKQNGVAINEELVIGNAAFSPSARPAVCRLARLDQIGDAAQVCVTSGGKLLLQVHAETVGSLCLTNSAGDTVASLFDTG